MSGISLINVKYSELEHPRVTSQHLLGKFTQNIPNILHLKLYNATHAYPEEFSRL